ncbi:hypothetical protein RS694_11210 [Rhodoferax saidenbachensis]|uniref:Uncharacterized protein n=1 Tax=Rhodoferax saidenbachensis TaxID=1484693 RepID=A0A1P8KAN8_9BURK|nr:hypothetical protein RS694_11210 [Rhodoferax saidenbachensis]
MPDFLITVPLDLRNMPPEVSAVVVWCDILNAKYAWDRSTASRNVLNPQNLALLQFNKVGPQTVATTGSLEIPVAVPRPATAGLPPAPWTIESTYWGNGNTNPGGMAPGDKLMIVPGDVAKTPNPSQSRSSVVLEASAQGAIDASLGTAYACHMGFKARAPINGKVEEFTVFAPDANTYTGMPFKGLYGADGKPAPASEVERSVLLSKVLHIYGNIPTPAASK